MRLSLCCLALGVLPALGQVGSTAVYTQFQQPPPQAVLDSMKEEVASIMSPAGLRLEWRPLDSVTGSEVFSELAVAKFKGRCDTSSLPPVHFQTGPLAWSHVTDGVVLPFTDVDCERIHAFLQSRLLRVATDTREKVLGRAMGRVLAHELYHIFARSTHHASRDVDKPYYTAAELVSDEFGFEQKESHILHLAAQPILNVKDRLLHSRSRPPQAGSSAYVRSGCNTCHGPHGLGSRNGPSLRPDGEYLDSVILAAKLERNGPKMSRRARGLRMPPPVLAEEDIDDLVRFLNTVEDQF